MLWASFCLRLLLYCLLQNDLKTETVVLLSMCVLAVPVDKGLHIETETVLLSMSVLTVPVDKGLHKNRNCFVKYVCTYCACGQGPT